jgi:hypothetical protein
MSNKMKRMRRKGLLLGVTVILFIGLFFLIACQSKSAKEEMAGKMVEKAIKESTGKEATVDIQGKNIRIQTKDGTGEINVTSTWPQDLPGDVPRFTMGKIKAVNKTDAGGTKNWNVVIEEAQEGALAKYADELKAKDWKIMTTTTVGSGGSVMATKNNLMAVVVFQTDKRTGAITVSQK